VESRDLLAFFLAFSLLPGFDVDVDVVKVTHGNEFLGRESLKMSLDPVPAATSTASAA